MKRESFIHITLFAFLIGIVISSCQMGCQSQAKLPNKKETTPISLPYLNGLNFVAPPEPFSVNPMTAVKKVAANWIAVIPYAFTRMDVPKVHYKGDEGHWWGERINGVVETIKLAKKEGVKVMLKPQVFVPRGWTGSLDFKTDADWAQWEEEYEKYLNVFVAVADSLNVDALCVGTEFKIGVQKRPEFWHRLIQKTRTKYKGLLTYAANWDEFELVPFWDELDFVGINAYFYLSDEKTPSVSQLTKAWTPYVKRIETFQQKTGKPIVFTEYGYLSVDYCASKSWELEAKIDSLSINQVAQANAIEALHKVWGAQNWWRGGFLWKWFPNMRGHEGYPEKDYTPQGKTAENVLKSMHEGHLK